MHILYIFFIDIENVKKYNKKMKTYTAKDIAILFRKDIKTIQRWDREGMLVAKRTPSNRRFYTQKQIDEFLGYSEEKKEKVAYVRVSSQSQKKDLKNQRGVIEEFCLVKGFSNVRYIEEIGGGLNFKRKKLTELMDLIAKKSISHVLIAHKDRLARFGYDWFEYFCNMNDCEIIILNIEKLSPEQEMVQDLMTIVHCFSSRLYGLRNYKKSLKEALKDESSAQNKIDSDRK